MERWVGRVAVVTGASAGIGAAIAEELVKQGLKVVGLARRVERVEELKLSLNKAQGTLYPLQCDITKEAEVTEAFNWITCNLGGVDVLVNNAGVASNNSLINGPVENWKKIMDLNVIALSMCTKEAIQSMKNRKIDDGHIIHINSIGGHGIPLHLFMYCASKHAVTALTEGLRREIVDMNSNIRVSSISPGRVRTEIVTASEFNIDPEHIYSKFPCLEAKDVAEAVVFVLGAPPHAQVHELTIRAVGEDIIKA